MLNGDYRAQQEIERVPEDRPGIAVFFLLSSFCPIGVFCGNNLAGRLKLDEATGWERECANRKLKLKRVHNEIRLIGMSWGNASSVLR